MASSVLNLLIALDSMNMRSWKTTDNSRPIVSWMTDTKLIIVKF